MNLTALMERWVAVRWVEPIWSTALDHMAATQEWAIGHGSIPRKAVMATTFAVGAFAAGATVSLVARDRQSADYSQSLFVRYDQLLSGRGDSRVVVRVNPVRERQEEASFWIDHSYLDNVDVKKISPQPLRVEYDSRRAYFFFNAAAQSLEIQIQMKPERWGWISGKMGVDERRWLSIDQLVYP